MNPDNFCIYADDEYAMAVAALFGANHVDLSRIQYFVYNFTLKDVRLVDLPPRHFESFVAGANPFLRTLAVDCTPLPDGVLPNLGRFSHLKTLRLFDCGLKLE
jgi:hypothetical protein